MDLINTRKVTFLNLLLFLNFLLFCWLDEIVSAPINSRGYKVSTNNTEDYVLSDSPIRSGEHGMVSPLAFLANGSIHKTAYSGFFTFDNPPPNSFFIFYDFSSKDYIQLYFGDGLNCRVEIDSGKLKIIYNGDSYSVSNSTLMTSSGEMYVTRHPWGGCIVDVQKDLSSLYNIPKLLSGSDFVLPPSDLSPLISSSFSSSSSIDIMITSNGDIEVKKVSSLHVDIPYLPPSPSIIHPIEPLPILPGKVGYLAILAYDHNGTLSRPIVNGTFEYNNIIANSTFLLFDTSFRNFVLLSAPTPLELKLVGNQGIVDIYGPNKSVYSLNNLQLTKKGVTVETMNPWVNVTIQIAADTDKFKKYPKSFYNAAFTPLPKGWNPVTSTSYPKFIGQVLTSYFTLDNETSVDYTSISQTVTIPSSNQLQALVFSVSANETFASVLYRKGNFSEVTTGYLGIIVPQGFKYEYHSSTITQKTFTRNPMFFIESGVLTYHDYQILDNSPWGYRIIYSHDHDALVLFLMDTLRTFSNTKNTSYEPPVSHDKSPVPSSSPSSLPSPSSIIHNVQPLPILPGKVGYLAILAYDHNGTLSRPIVNGTFEYNNIIANSTFLLFDTSFRNFVLLSAPTPLELKLVGNQGIVDIYGPNKSVYSLNNLQLTKKGVTVETMNPWVNVTIQIAADTDKFKKYPKSFYNAAFTPLPKGWNPVTSTSYPKFIGQVLTSYFTLDNETSVDYTSISQTVTIPSSNQLQALVFSVSANETFASVLYRKGNFSEVTTGYLGIIVPQGFKYEYHSSTITQKTFTRNPVFFIESGILTYHDYQILDNSPWGYRIIYSHDHDALVLFLMDTLKTYLKHPKPLYGSTGSSVTPKLSSPGLSLSPPSNPSSIIHNVQPLPILPGKVGHLAILAYDHNGTLSRPIVNGTFEYNNIIANSTFLLFDTSFRNFVLLSAPTPLELKLVGNQGIVDIYGPNKSVYSLNNLQLTKKGVTVETMNPWVNVTIQIAADTDKFKKYPKSFYNAAFTPLPEGWNPVTSTSYPKFIGQVLTSYFNLDNETSVDYTSISQTVTIPSSNQLQALVFSVSANETFASVLYRKGNFSEVTTGYLGIIVPQGFKYEYHSSTITQKTFTRNPVFFIESGILTYHDYQILDNSPWGYKVIYSSSHNSLVLFLKDTLKTYLKHPKPLYGSTGSSVTPKLSSPGLSLSPPSNPSSVIHTVDPLPILPGKVGHLAILAYDHNGTLSRPIVNGTFEYDNIIANSTFLLFDTSFRNFVLLSAPTPLELKLVGNQGIVDIYGPNKSVYSLNNLQLTKKGVTVETMNPWVNVTIQIAADTDKFKKYPKSFYNAAFTPLPEGWNPVTSTSYPKFIGQVLTSYFTLDNETSVDYTSISQTVTIPSSNQ
ncbi:uncharacterized protein CMU_030300, partial [Cryptosporidium muris RN66]